MYRCERCNAVVPPNVRERREVVEVRDVTYPPREQVNRVKRRGRVKFTDDPGGTGHETARERRLCPRCAATQTG